MRPGVVLSHTCALLCGFAFTVVCAIVGLPAFMSYTCIGTYDCHGQPRTAARSVSAIEQAVIAYEIEHNALPTTKDDLVDGGYVAKQEFTDPWGKPITLTCSKTGVRVASAGPDGLPGTADDITN